MKQCKRGMNKEEVFTELTKDNMGKCNGCDNLVYQDGIMTCPFIDERSDEEDTNEN